MDTYEFLINSTSKSLLECLEMAEQYDRAYAASKDHDMSLMYRSQARKMRRWAGRCSERLEHWMFLAEATRKR